MQLPGRTPTLLLVALSGVRVRDKELLELGMTLPGFVDRGKVIAPVTRSDYSRGAYPRALEH